MKDVYLRSIRRITVVCRFLSSLWVSGALTCLFAVLWEGWKLALPGIRVAAWEECDRSALHQREEVIVQLLFQRLDSENSISCLQDLSVPPGLPLCFAFWPGRSGRALRRCSWCAGCVCGGSGSGSSQHWEAVKSLRLMCWATYSVVEVGLGGWFSGQQSSVGEGRPSESSLSRWTCGKVWPTIWKNIRQTVCSVSLGVQVMMIEVCYWICSCVVSTAYLSVPGSPSVMMADHGSVLTPRGRPFELTRSPLWFHFLLLHKVGYFLEESPGRDYLKGWRLQWETSVWVQVLPCYLVLSHLCYSEVSLWVTSRWRRLGILSVGGNFEIRCSFPWLTIYESFG